MYIMLFLIKLWSYKCLEYRETVVVMRFLCHFRMRDFSSTQEMRFYNYKQKLRKDIPNIERFRMAFVQFQFLQ